MSGGSAEPPLIEAGGLLGGGSIEHASGGSAEPPLIEARGITPWTPTCGWSGGSAEPPLIEATVSMTDQEPDSMVRRLS